ncbi:MAG: alpha/beta hydrolase [Gemmatimonadetes bacterium]|nr:alpha/beta hydrolase [Gemmatimonadota bacterium]
MRTVLITILILYLALGALAWYWSERALFQPPPATYRADQDIIHLSTADGVRLAALWLPNPGAAFTILYSHGNAEDLGWSRPALEELRELGFAVFAYDYRGYGLSEGRPSERGAYLDIEAAYQHVTRALGVPAERIIVHGLSLGGGPSVLLAATRPVAGLILESTFTTAFRVVTRVPLFPIDRFRNLQRLRRVHCPVLVIHGTDDEVIPFSHGPRLFAAAPEPRRRLWVEGATHNDLRVVAGAAYERALVEFRDLLLEGAHVRVDGRQSTEN